MSYESESTARELAAMSSMLEDYLLDEQLFKTIGVEGDRSDYLIKMTIGAMLERMAQLEEHDAAPDVVTAARSSLNHARSMMGDRYVARLAREAKSYTDSWRWFLQNCWQGDESCVLDYPTEVATRLRLARLLDEGAGQPALDEARQRVAALDDQLRKQWQPASSPHLGLPPDRYPRDRYWWLYGLPAAPRPE